MVRLLLMLLLLGSVSCRKYIQFSPNEVRLEEWEKNLNQKNIQKLESSQQKSQFKFVVVGDSQRFYEQLDDLVSHVNQRTDIAFLVLNGDITDFGLNKEFRWVNERLRQLKVPYIAIIGNHDMLANGRQVYKEMFGEDNFSFSYGNCKFICLNSNSRETGFDGTLPNLKLLDGELADLSKYHSAFVLSHVPPFHQDFDATLSQPYATLLASTGKVRLSIHGHDHSYSINQPYGANVPYLVTGSINHRTYALISVTDETYEIEKVEY